MSMFKKIQKQLKASSQVKSREPTQRKLAAQLETR